MADEMTEGSAGTQTTNDSPAEGAEPAVEQPEGAPAEETEPNAGAETPSGESEPSGEEGTGEGTEEQETEGSEEKGEGDEPDPADAEMPENRERLLMEAAQLGLSHEDVAGFNNAQVAKLIDITRKRGGGKEGEDRAAAVPQGSLEDIKFAPEMETLETLEKAIPEAYENAKEVMQLHGVTKSMVGKLKQMLDHQIRLSDLHAKRWFDTLSDSVERGIESMGPEYEGLFGKGSIYDLKPGTPARENRRKLFAEVNTLLQRYDLTLPNPALIRKAVASAFWDQHKAVARKEIEAKQLKREKSRPILNPQGQGKGGMKPDKSLEDEVSEMTSRFLNRGRAPAKNTV